MKQFFIYRYFKILVLGIFLLFVNSMLSQDTLSHKQGFFSKMMHPDSTQTFRYKLVPVITYSPETNFGFGAGFIFNWDYKNATAGTNSSMAQSFFIYTLNKQMEWISIFEIYTNDNNFTFTGNIGYFKFPQFYYGVGNEIPFDQREDFSFQQIYFDIKSRVKVYKSLYFGIDYYFNTNYDVEWSEESHFANDSTLYGTNGYLISGIGPEIVLDTRDYPFNPSKGYFLSASALFFFDGLGSDLTYNYYTIDYRQFFLINKSKRWVLGLNLYGLFAKGDVPFNRLPALGNSQIMRGYYNGRFRDHNYIAGQLEWRMPIWKFIGATAWVGTGQVAANFSYFRWDGLKPNFGVGLRFLFDKKSKMNVRADEGFGKNSNGFYFKIKEAF